MFVAYTDIMNIYEKVGKELRASGADVFSIGHSACGADILCAHKGGYDGTQIIVTAAIHARECYTALAVLRQAREFDADDGAYFVPLVNPDGAVFFETGDDLGSKFLRANKAHRRDWKANAAGVDLNCNFDALFGRGALNTFSPGPHGYVGEKPFCAPESKALADFTLDVKPRATVSYHCMGGELYWEFFQTGERRARDEEFAKVVADRISVKKVDGDLCSAGGYKDWCVSVLGIPAVTVELIRSGVHPFLPEDYAYDIALNARLPEFILGYINEHEI